MTWIHKKGKIKAVSDNLIDAAQQTLKDLGPFAELRLLSEERGIEITVHANQASIIKQRMENYTCVITEEIRDSATVLTLKPK